MSQKCFQNTQMQQNCLLSRSNFKKQINFCLGIQVLQLKNSFLLKYVKYLEDLSLSTSHI